MLFLIIGFILWIIIPLFFSIRIKLIPKSLPLSELRVIEFIIFLVMGFLLYFHIKVSFFLYIFDVVVGKLVIYMLYFSLFLHVLFLYIAIFSALYSLFM